MSSTKYVDTPVAFTVCWIWNTHFTLSTLPKIASNTLVVVLLQARLPINTIYWTRTECFTCILYFTNEQPPTRISIWDSWIHQVHNGWCNYFYIWHQNPWESSQILYAYVEKRYACFWQSIRFTLSDQNWNIWDYCFQAKTIYPPSHNWALV